MILRTLGVRIADNERISYAVGLIIGLILYFLLLYYIDWNPITILTSVIFLEFSVITGLVMRFLSGIGIALTYASFCVIFFRVLSPMLKRKTERTRVAKILVLLPAIALVGYAFYKIWSASVLATPLTTLELITTIFGVWSLMIMVYVIPLIKREYTPDLDDVKGGGVQERLSGLRFSVWKGYQSRIKQDYGRIAEGEYERFGARMYIVRVILSGLLLLPISLVLFKIPPLAVIGVMLWFRVFSLNHKHYSDLERLLLILVTLAVAIVTTISFFQIEQLAFLPYFDATYGIGLLTGLLVLFAIILRR